MLGHVNVKYTLLRFSCISHHKYSYQVRPVTFFLYFSSQIQLLGQTGYIFLVFLITNIATRLDRLPLSCTSHHKYSYQVRLVTFFLYFSSQIQLLGQTGYLFLVFLITNIATRLDRLPLSCISHHKYSYQVRLVTFFLYFSSQIQLLGQTGYKSRAISIHSGIQAGHNIGRS